MTIKPYVYVLEHQLNYTFYIGVRMGNKKQASEDLGVKYFTSSKYVKPVFSQFNIKEIIECESREEAYTLEQEMIKEHWGDVLMLNRAFSGSGNNSFDWVCPPNHVTVVDQSGKKFRVHKSDERIKTGELVGHNKNRKHPEEEIKRRANSNTGKGTPAIEVSSGKSLGKVSKKDIRWQTGEIVHPNKGKNKPDGFGEIISNNRNGIKLSEEHRESIRKSCIGKKQSKTTIEKRAAKISELKWINDGDITLRVKVEVLNEFINAGWFLGRKK